MTRRTWWLLAGSIALLAFGASATSLPNRYAYDDVYVIQKDARMHTLTHWWTHFQQSYWSRQWGGDGYRPLTNLGFAVEWVVGHGSPLIFHVLNVLLYMVLCVVVLWVLTGVLPRAPAWIAAALFAVHPVHVEAVGNIVGQSELTTALLLTAAMGLYIYGRERGPLSIKRQLTIALMYAGAMLFKENGIVLVALVVVAEATVVHDPRPLKTRLVEMRPFVLGLTAVAMGYLWARDAVLSGRLTGFRPYPAFQGLRLSTPDRILTMIGLAPQWGRLFFWPAHLTTEYSPPYAPIAQGVSITQLPGLLLIVGAIGLFFALRRKVPAASFGLGWVIVAISPVSNLVLPAGFLIAERTLLFPSIGAMMFLGALIPPVYEWLAAHRLQLAGVAAVALLLAAGGWRSAQRQKVWFDDDVLFRHGVKDSPDSYRSHFMLGAWYMQNKRYSDGEKEYEKGMRLFPYDPYMAFSLGEDYRRWAICKPAINLYRWAIGLDSNIVVAWPQLADCLFIEHEYRAAKKAAIAATRHSAPIEAMHGIIVSADSALRVAASRKPAAPDSGEMRRTLQNTLRVGSAADSSASRNR